MPILLQINCCNNVYSTGKIVGDIGGLVVKKGWKSYIAYQRDYKESLSEPIVIGNMVDWCLNGLEQRIFDNTGFGIGSFFSTKKLIKKIEEIKPDIIHLHVLVGYYLHFKLLFRYLSKLDIPVVWTLHSCWEMTGHCTHFDYEGCYRWKTECHDCPLKKDYPQSFLFDRSRKNYRQKKELFTSLKNLHLVAVSKWLGGVVSESFFKEKPIHIIFNGIDLKSFRPLENVASLKQQYHLEGKFVALGVSSSWQPKKGQYDYYLLAEKLPSDYVIVMIGLSEKQIKELPKNIIGVKKTTSVEELRNYYCLSDVVLNLSYEETFGLTTVEGMACGTPSIVYDRTASPELVTHETGFVVKAGDIDGILRCINIIKEKGKSSYEAACRNRAVYYYDKDKNFQLYLDLYDNLLNKE